MPQPETLPAALRAAATAHADLPAVVDGDTTLSFSDLHAAVRDPEFVKAAARAFPGRVAVGIDARDGMAAVEGWAETTDIAAEDLARRFEDAGVAAIIHTDIDRDGAMQGPNIAASAALAHAVSIPVIVSGGVSSMDDIRAAKACGAPLDGVISGRALYDGRLDPAEAAAILAA